LGDYYLAVKTIENIDLQNKQGLFTQVPACHITLYYYTGFVYMMMRRYVDAIKTFGSVLVFISRTKQYHSRSYQYENLMKKNEQMYGLLAICLSLCPQRVDESVHPILRERYSDKMVRMQKGEEAVFEELFNLSCPKFINASSPNYALLLEDASKYPALNYNQEAVRLQTKWFLNELKQQGLLATIRSYLKLYTTIGTQKLADFLETDEKTFRTQLLCYKHKTRGLVWTGGSPLSGEIVSYSDVDFFVEKNMVVINDTKTQRRYSDFFIRHTEKLLNLSSQHSHGGHTE
jgi:translation initiation factor 3 subunit L